MPKVKVKNLTGKIALTATVAAALIHSASIFIGKPGDPSPVTNGITLISLGLVIVAESFIVRNFRPHISWRDPAHVVALVLAAASVLLGALMAFSVPLASTFQGIVGFLFIINAIVAVILAFR